MSGSALTSTKTPRLFHFRISHYNEKVRWALDFKRWPHRRKALVPGFHVTSMQLKTGQRKVPVLELDGTRLIGSAHIIGELERRRPDPPLYPAGEADRARALAIQAWFDDQVAPAVRRLVWSSYIDQSSACCRMVTHGFSRPTRIAFRAAFPLMRPLIKQNIGLDRKRVEAARAGLAGVFDRLESEIGPSGYLVADSIGLADLAAASVMSVLVRPPEFSYPAPQPYPDAFAALQAGIAGRRGFEWVQKIYARHRGSSAEIAAD